MEISGRQRQLRLGREEVRPAAAAEPSPNAAVDLPALLAQLFGDLLHLDLDRVDSGPALDFTRAALLHLARPPGRAQRAPGPERRGHERDQDRDPQHRVDEADDGADDQADRHDGDEEEDDDGEQAASHTSITSPRGCGLAQAPPEATTRSVAMPSRKPIPSM